MGLISKRDFAAALNLDKLKLQSLAGPLMSFLKLDEVNDVHASLQPLQGIDFIDGLIDKLGIEVVITEAELKNIPLEGGFIALSNHPYGGLDGVILIKLLGRIRPDFRVMANFLLKKIDNISPFFISVNPFENKAAFQKFSMAGIKETLNELNQNHPVGIFPAGEVSAMQKTKWKVSDKEWNPAVARIIQKSGKPVLPIYFHGSNSLFFNVLGLAHPSLRTAALANELFNKKGSKIKVRIGKLISTDEIQSFKNDKHLIDFLRAKSYALGSPLTQETALNNLVKNPMGAQPEPVQQSIDKTILQKELDQLPASDKLFSLKQFDTYIVDKKQIPLMIQEIGRQREITFRQVGEGTNNKIDLDDFDDYYKHLFIWDSQEKELVGAYRIGCGDSIFKEKGKKGFYTNTLFRMDDALGDMLQQCLELGRSFIRKEYQQKALPLMLLWRGILTYLKQNPQYRYLFGPVSISNSFSKISKAIMIHYIKQFYFDKELAKLVEPRKQFVSQDEEAASGLLINDTKTTLNSVDELIAEIEPNHYGIPVLMKKYIKQNAKIIAFNVDPLFNNALDGLMILDITKVPENTVKMLEKESV